MPMKEQKGGRGIDLPIFKLGSRIGWSVNTTLQPLYPWERDPVPMVQQARWASRSVWPGTENLAAPRYQPRNVGRVASRYTDYAIPAAAFK